VKRLQAGYLLAILMTALPAMAGDVRSEDYPFLGDLPDAPEVRPLSDAFAVPTGYHRVEVAADSFGAWLRGLPVRTERTEVLSYRGDPLTRPSIGVVAMDVGERDLQQCADSAIRLHAEWLWSQGRADEAGYHFTSGDLSTWRAWRGGERFVVQGSRVDRVAGAPRPDDHANFRRWLDQVFTYAGTRSLRLDSDPVPVEDDLQAGDFFVQAGSPGHAVMILDVAVDSAGQRVALIGQGFMPAEDFHVVGWPGVAVDGAWFPLPETEDGVVRTPSWAPFERVEARRFK